MIGAITFDFWDTIVADDSDEPKRAALGLPSKAEARLALFLEEIASHHHQLCSGDVVEAFNQANERFTHTWTVDYRTLTVAERFRLAYGFLGIPLSPGFESLVSEVEGMELAIQPDFLPGVGVALAQLGAKFRLGIISDAIHTSGRGIRRLLEGQGLLQHFRCCVFSDEAGASKPAAAVFELAAAGLGVPLAQIIHIGDRESNDVAGPLAMGMKAILCTAAKDRGSAITRAHAVCADFAELPAIVHSLN